MTMEYKNIEINYCNIYSDEEIHIKKIFAKPFAITMIQSAFKRME